MLLMLNVIMASIIAASCAQGTLSQFSPAATSRVEKMHHAGGWCWGVTVTMFDKGRS